MDEAILENASSHKIIGNYRLGKTLGIGAFGKVKIGLHTPTKLKVAIKILDRQFIDDPTAERVKREINIMRSLSHPHIVRLYEVIETKAKIYVVIEYMNSGELFDYITENGRLQEDVARNFFQQIIAGVEYCHLNMVAHRDLKPENLLVDSHNNIKIADFGLSDVMRDGHFLKTSCGSPNYAAPEVISQRLYAGPEVDVWSCGVILFALLCGRLPFDDDNISRLFAKIKSGIYTFPNHLSRAARDLIARILVIDPMKRISITEIHKHPWFNQDVPRYIAMRTVDATYHKNEVDEQIIQQVVNMGFNFNEVIHSLYHRLQTEATVAYYLLLDNRFGANSCLLKNELMEPSEASEVTEMYISPPPPIRRQWALGLKSRGRPIDTMTTVLKVLERMNIKWKKMGPYNMKCLWMPPSNTYSKQTADDNPGTNHIYAVSSSTMSAKRRRSFKSVHAVKFEIQLYKTADNQCILDMQMLHGPPFMFLEICAAFIGNITE